jgi:peptide/nickel transport system substrate-binding protein
MRPHRIASFATCTAVLLFAACGPDAGQTGPVGDPVQGGTAVVGVLTDFQTFNPVTNTSLTTMEVMWDMLFTPLVQFDGDLNVQPHLAESWELSDTAVTFRLRNDVRWHDGQPVTADDVKFTFDLAKDPATASLLGAAYINMVQSATVIDPHTIHFRFIAPHAQALENFWWPPMPRHLLGNVTAADLGQAQYNNQPVGSGPFRFVSWDRGQRLTVEANPDFPAGLGGRPNLDRVVFRIIPEQTTMVTELLSGSADLIAYGLQPDQARQLEGQRGVHLEHFPSRSFTYIGWNNQRPQFNDPRVRRALAMAMNRPHLIEGLLHGYAEPASGMVPPWSPMYEDIDPLPYDPATARQLLAEAGWQDTNADGIVDRGGQPLRFTLLVNAANRMHQDLATVLQRQWREIGADVQIQTVEFQTMLRQHRARDYDAVISGWTLDTFKVDPTPLFSCEEARKEQSANRAGYCNPRADQLMQQGLRTTDPGQARGVWSEFSRILQQDQPITFLFWTEDLAGIGRRIQNVEMDVRSKLVNAHEWWIPANQQR